MSEKSGIDIGQIAMIGALLVGGYFVLKYVMPLLKGLGDVGGAVQTVTAIPGQVITAVTTPIVPATDLYPRGPTPIEIGIPPLGIPAAVRAAQTPVGGRGTPTPSTAALLFPPLGIIEAATQIPRLISATINPLSRAVTPVQTSVGGPITLVPVTQSLHGLINPATGFRYSGR